MSAEILKQIEHRIKIDRIKLIPITERDLYYYCKGQRCQNQHLKCMDVEKEMANITINTQDTDTS
jgi:hypothetical protein